MKRAILAMSGLLFAASAATATVGGNADRQAQPRVLAPIEGGLWEITQLGSDARPRRLCLRDVSVLAQYEHMGRECTRVTVNESGKKALVRYTCTAGGFGTSEFEVVTPRSITVKTQGIKNGYPFNRTLLARRTGSC
ncbi:DUF3617 family protein [Sphingomicrobium sp. XHP0239]|uniref:DUF3617 domain-containing protein n=1 Tax=Sphingomicrobium maritimum TaxID=3133972 RepID=UPI0031CC6F50